VSAGEIKEVPIRRGTLYQYRQHVVDCDLAQRLGCSLKAVLLKRVSASEQQNLGVKPGKERSASKIAGQRTLN
jgi:hypothetical protein